MLALPPSKDQSQGSSAGSGSAAPGADAANSVSDEWLPELPQEKEWDGFEDVEDDEGGYGLGFYDRREKEKGRKAPGLGGEIDPGVESTALQGGAGDTEQVLVPEKFRAEVNRDLLRFWCKDVTGEHMPREWEPKVDMLMEKPDLGNPTREQVMIALMKCDGHYGHSAWLLGAMVNRPESLASRAEVVAHVRSMEGMGTVKPSEVAKKLEEHEWDPDDAYADLKKEIDQRMKEEENKRKQEAGRASRRGSALMLLRNTVAKVNITAQLKKKSTKEIAKVAKKEMRGLEDDTILQEIQQEQERKLYKKRMHDALRGIRARTTGDEKKEEELAVEDEEDEDSEEDSEEGEPSKTLAEELMELRQMAEVKQKKELSNAGERVPYGHVQVDPRKLLTYSYGTFGWASVAVLLLVAHAWQYYFMAVLDTELLLVRAVVARTEAVCSLLLLPAVTAMKTIDIAAATGTYRDPFDYATLDGIMAPGFANDEQLYELHLHRPLTAGGGVLIARPGRVRTRGVQQQPGRLQLLFASDRSDCHLLPSPERSCLARPTGSDQDQDWVQRAVRRPGTSFAFVDGPGLLQHDSMGVPFASPFEWKPSYGLGWGTAFGRLRPGRNTPRAGAGGEGRRPDRHRGDDVVAVRVALDVSSLGTSLQRILEDARESGTAAEVFVCDTSGVVLASSESSFQTVWVDEANSRVGFWQIWEVPGRRWAALVTEDFLGPEEWGELRDESLDITITVAPLRVRGLRAGTDVTPLRVLMAAPKRAFVEPLLLQTTTVSVGVAVVPLVLLVLWTLLGGCVDLCGFNLTRRHREMDMLADRRYKKVEIYRSQPDYTPSLLNQGYQKSRYDMKRRGSFGRRGSKDLGGRRGSGDFGRRGSGDFGRRSSKTVGHSPSDRRSSKTMGHSPSDRRGSKT